jgi:hypothetical protein
MFGDGSERSTILRTGPDGLKLGQPEESSGAGRSFTARRWRSRLVGERTRADCELWWRLTATAAGKRAAVSTGTRLAEESFQSHPMSTNPTR